MSCPLMRLLMTNTAKQLQNTLIIVCLNVKDTYPKSSPCSTVSIVIHCDLKYGISHSVSEFWEVERDDSMFAANHSWSKI